MVNLVLLAVAIVAWPTALAYGPAPVSELVLMTEAAQRDGAVCLDGSPGGYYFREGAVKDKFVIFFQGGGWCYDEALCYTRAQTVLGSSTLFPKNRTLSGGLLEVNATQNPDFAQWSAIYMPYCDGASFSGDATDPVVVNGTKIYFRGHRILQAMIANMSSKGLSDATSIIVTGGSAGGLATFLHVDWIASQFPSADVRAVTDCGFFVDSSNVWGHSFTTEEYAYVARMQNVTGGPGTVNDACVAATPVSRRWQCFMAQFTYPHIKAPLFVLNAKYDAWQLGNIWAPSGDDAGGDAASYRKCYTDPTTGCNATQMFQLQGYAIQFLEAINMSIAFNPNGYSRNGGMITACIEHGQMDAGYNKLSVGGLTVQQAIHNWYFQTNGPDADYWLFDGLWPNNPTCAGPLIQPGSCCTNPSSYWICGDEDSCTPRWDM